MKYTLQKTNYRNFKVFRDNITEPRAYFIPFKTLEGAKNADVRTERYSSDMTRCLSGEWDFKFYPHCARVPDEIDTSRVRFDTVPVPSVWQRTGYAEPVYINHRYEFDLTPPEIPEDMPAGIYRKKFTVDDMNKVYILSFLGAANNIEVYVNGSYIGYSEGSHNTAEFDITEKIVNGENELLVLMYKWCCGTYLECQDMFRDNGIFRDVLLTAYDKSYIYDYFIKYKKNGERYDVSCCVDIPVYSEGCTVKAALCDNDRVIISEEKKASQKTEFNFRALDVKEWNAEEPYLYKVYITLFENGSEIMSLRSYTGFKTVEIKDNIYYFNGRKIKFKGVNHHDSNPKTGFVLTADDIERDIKLMKELNVNAVRTSHYPPDPLMLILCDMYGLYVVDEADIETHGTNELFGTMDTISMDLKWKHHYLDRVARMYKRDRNRACVAMWSLGNESGGYKCQDYCVDWLRKEGAAVPIHYEGVVRTKRVAYDLISEMYTHPDDVRKIGKCMGKYKSRYVNVSKPYTEKPFFLCEYAHSMGVGPGSLEDYWNIFYKYDNLMGGCIWEWCDHSVYHEKGKSKYVNEYTYGGDHKEKRHDGNFCVDGLMYPDRAPHTGAREMKQAYRPVRFELVGGNTFKITNTNRFRNTSYLEFRWELLQNGALYDSGSLKLDIAPEETAEIDIDFKLIDNDNDYILTLIALDGEREVSREQAVLNDVAVTYKLHDTGKISVESDGNRVTVGFDGGKAVFCAECGRLVSYEKKGKEYLNQAPASGIKGFEPNVYRAPLDNDMYIKKNHWDGLKLEKAAAELDSFDVCIDSCCASVMSVYLISSGKKDLFECMVDYTVSPKGEIKVRAVLNKLCDETVELPRFGMTVELPEEFTNVEYYGRGPYENLPDMTVQSPIGIYKAKVHDMHEPYIFPQDNSEHCNVKWLKISDNSGNSLRFFAEERFAFNIHDYTQKNLVEAKHREDIVTVPSSVLTVDGYVRGSGTNSCGPETLPEYRIDEDSMLIYEFTVVAE